MRVMRLGQTSRLVLITVVLILIIPVYFLNQLESIDHVDRVAEVPPPAADDHVVEEKVETTKKVVRIQKLTNVSLQPVMGDGPGNYEPTDLPARSGPGEGGQFGSGETAG